MAEAIKPAPSPAAAVAFKPDRFGFAPDRERLELSGRWFGVRGRRFVRPSLIVASGDGEVRLLADLEHKPWAAEDGEPWEATFPCNAPLEDVGPVELTVSPDVTVTLPTPDRAESRGRKRTRRTAQPRRDAEPPGPDGPPQRAQGREETASSELERARAEIGLLRERLDRAMADLEERTAQSRAELDRAESDAEETRQRVTGTLKSASDARRAQEAALAERDTAITERSRAQAERDRAVAERDRIAAEHETLRVRYEQTLATHGASLVMRNAAIAGSARRSRAHWLTTASAVTALIIVALALAFVLGNH